MHMYCTLVNFMFCTGQNARFLDILQNICLTNFWILSLNLLIWIVKVWLWICFFISARFFIVFFFNLRRISHPVILLGWKIAVLALLVSPSTKDSSNAWRGRIPVNCTHPSSHASHATLKQRSFCPEGTCTRPLDRAAGRCCVIVTCRFGKSAFFSPTLLSGRTIYLTNLRASARTARLRCTRR
jgi:hypothetical protein